MGYKVKWVEDHLGVSRKALRGFEEAGLMPPNKDGKYRDYDDDDLDRIWAIRLLQGMGFTLKDIASFIAQLENDDDFVFENTLAHKIEELEKKKQKIERHLGYARTIKLTGRFPARPAKMGEIRFDDFHEKALEGWNMANDPQVEEYQKVVETFLAKPQEEIDNTDFGRLITMLEQMVSTDTSVLMAQHVLPAEISKRRKLAADHPEIQLMVKMLYDGYRTIHQLESMSTVQFARFYSTTYLSGDISKIVSQGFSKEESEFIAEAIAIFGGFESYSALLEEEAHYGSRKAEFC